MWTNSNHASQLVISTKNIKKQTFLQKVDCIKVFIRLPALIFHHKLIACTNLKYIHGLLWTLIVCGNRTQCPFWIFSTFSHSKNFIFACCLERFHVQITLKRSIHMTTHDTLKQEWISGKATVGNIIFSITHIPIYQHSISSI